MVMEFSVENKNVKNIIERIEQYLGVKEDVQAKYDERKGWILEDVERKGNGEPEEAKALIENALGFALAAQNDFKSAVIHYKKALTGKSEYPVALNNLGFAYQRLLKEGEAYKNYQEVLKLDPNNKTAISQIKRLERIIGKDKDQLLKKKGF